MPICLLKDWSLKEEAKPGAEVSVEDRVPRLMPRADTRQQCLRRS